jgi:hypothetical protein
MAGTDGAGGFSVAVVGEGGGWAYADAIIVLFREARHSYHLFS